jgi:hypothetical protein
MLLLDDAAAAWPNKAGGVVETAVYLCLFNGFPGKEAASGSNVSKESF